MSILLTAVLIGLAGGALFMFGFALGFSLGKDKGRKT